MSDSKPAGDFRCALGSQARDESGAGTASTVRAFLLIEESGPWGVDAMRDARLPDGLGPVIASAARRAGVRPLLIRRPTRTSSATRRIFAAHADPNTPWLESGEVSDLREVLDLNLAGLGTGTSAGLTRQQDPVLAVCTHGRHDACCAELGRPVVRSLADHFTEQTWEVSHVGGDRFAGNLVVLPHGLYFGRVDPASSVRIAAAHAAGRIDLEHLRGRSGLSMPAQAAEIHLRTSLHLDGHDDLRFVEAVSENDLTAVRFVTRDDAVRVVRVRAHRGEPARLTCRSQVDRATIVYEIVDVTPYL